MANLQPSFRFPASLPADAGDKRVLDALTQHSNGLVDVNAAIVALNLKVSTIAPAAPTGTPTVVETGVSYFNAETGEVIYFPSMGFVNNQSGVTAYTTQTQDNGALVVLAAASAIAVTLNFNVAAPWFTTISNQGTSTITITPSSGLVNGAASATLNAGNFSTIFFDGKNWWSDAPASGGGGSGVTQIIAGTNVTISPTGGTGAVTVNASSGTAGVTQIVAGTGISVSPAGGTGAVTVTNTATGGSGYLKGIVNVSVSGPGTYDGTGTITGAAVGNPSCCALRGGPNNPPGFPTTLQNILCGVSSANTVTVQLVVPSGTSMSGTIIFDVAVFP